MYCIISLIMDKWDKIFLWVIAMLVIVTIASTAYKFLFAKNYDFVVEAPCNTATSTCFTRDCSNPDDCPPNGLSNYRVFNIKAADFEKCSDNSCLNECASGKISCKEIKCGESKDDECSEH
jgi:hypothetical protein